jgi:hypothetical protein
VGVSGVQLPLPSLPKELSVVEVETQICKVLEFVVIPSPGAGPNPLQRGIASVRVSTLGPY